MDLHTELLKEHSRKQTEKIAGWIGNDAERFAALVKCFVEGEPRIAQRAAWVLRLATEKQLQLAIPYLGVIIKKAASPGEHAAIKRNVVRIFNFVEIPEDVHGDVMNLCFALLATPGETIAVRVCSMYVLSTLARAYPDIRFELRQLIDDILLHEPTPGLKAAAKKVLKTLK